MFKTQQTCLSRPLFSSNLKNMFLLFRGNFRAHLEENSELLWVKSFVQKSREFKQYAQNVRLTSLTMGDQPPFSK